MAAKSKPMAKKLKQATGLFSLEGKVVFLSGAGGHLGAAMAHGVAEAGGTVILNGRDPEKLKKLQTELKKNGGKAVVWASDITDEKQHRATAKFIEKEFGRLDVLINNAYAGRTGSVKVATLEDFTDSYDIAVSKPFRLIQTLMPLLKKSAAENPAGSSIINIASMYGMVSPDPRIYDNEAHVNPPFYGAAKGAVLQLTKYLGCALAPDKIRVNAISPGPFPPPTVAKSNPGFWKKLQGKSPMGRVGRADELKGPVVFLSSDASSYMTGSNVVVDGGWTAW